MTDTIDGVEITAHRGALRNAGDGLSKALKLKDHTLHVGDEVVLLVKGKVVGPSFKADPDDEAGIMRVDNIRVGSAQVVEGVAEIEVLVKEHEEAVTEMLEQEREAKEGIKRLPLDGNEDRRQADEDGLGPDDTRPLRSIEGGGEGDKEADNP